VQTCPTPYASIRFLFIGSRLCFHASFIPLLAETPLRFAITSSAMRRIVKGTLTLQLLDMLGTHVPGQARRALAPSPAPAGSVGDFLMAFSISVLRA